MGIYMFKIIMIILLFIILLYLFLIKPKAKSKTNFEAFNGWFYAHRGLHNNNSDAPENSLKAFSMAVTKKYGIELDVQLTKDNIPVVFHDDTLLRVCGENQYVNKLTLKELKEYHLFQSKEKIPTLDEVLSVINGEVPLILEYKSKNTSSLIYEIVSKRLQEYQGIYCIESFNPYCLFWYKKNEPFIVRGQLASRLLQDSEFHSGFFYFMLENLLFNFITKPDFIAYKFQDKNMLSYVLCKKLYKVTTFAWTIRSWKDYEISKEDFDYFIFDSFYLK
ncbi:glycerophosphodiester phosphodiesterase family protein [Anaeromicropila herbilytica]|uniref:GP-PDE domain-containing protein n=1 Tax=Anaeromicropila herbilytica TaxID=2785025 RepID=A0A7R7EJ71_9FIRM|nr:glycerophosphodiester phosphodiesterase family protein [Anaeromicropila herbilytica]BCN29745.1 hypothetical protein bsdtb5_10400 [Anaeromicropila herbilytica]